MYENVPAKVRDNRQNNIWQCSLRSLCQRKLFAVHTCLSEKKSSALVELISCISSSVTLVNRRP